MKTPPGKTPGRRHSEKGGDLARNVTGNQLGHFEHADLGLAVKHGLQLVISIDLGLYLLVLQTVLLDVIPQFLGELGAGQRLAANNGGKDGVRGDRGHELSVRGAGCLLYTSSEPTRPY